MRRTELRMLIVAATLLVFATTTISVGALGLTAGNGPPFRSAGLAPFHLFGVILLQDLLLAAGLCTLFWWIFLRPLNEIERYASAARGGSPAPSLSLSRRPASRTLASLRKSIEHLSQMVRKNETMLSSILDAVPYCIWWKDQHGTYLGCNQMFAVVAGRRHPAEVIGNTDYDLSWPREEVAGYRADDREVLTTNRAKRHIIEPITHAGGPRRWVDTTKVPLADTDGTPYAVLGVAEDITERKEAEDALRHEKAITDAVFDSVPAVLCLFDDQQRPVRWNRRSQEISGYTDVDYVRAQKVLWDTPAAKTKIAAAIDTVLRTGRGEVEEDLVTKEGKRIPYYYMGVRLMLDGKPHALAIGVDISERKRAEEHLRRALGQAEEANRAKDRFLAAASHELRTPLTPVLLLSSSLEGDTQLPSEVRRDLGVIREHVELEKRLIADLLDFTAIHSGKLHMSAVATDIHDVIRAAVRTCRQGMEHKGLHLDVQFHAQHHHTRADPDRLRQVFWNLLQNACKFTPADCSVSVRTSDDYGIDGHTLRVEVTDSGRGIDAETLRRIFRPFEQGPRDERMQHYGGLGLGLAIAKALVEAHGGSISAMSEGPGHGSTFVVCLPITAPSPPSAPPRQIPQAQPARLKLLLVEDHPLTLKTLERLLTAEGHDVTTATTAAEALQAAATGHFDLILSDLGLPDGSGLELMPALRDRYGLPGIAISGFGADTDLEASRDAGFLSHLIKPVTIETLRHALSQFAHPTPTTADPP